MGVPLAAMGCTPDPGVESGGSRAVPIPGVEMGRPACVAAGGMGHLVTADDAKEQDMAGKLRETKSGGRCLFRMVTKSDMVATLRAVLS